MAEMFFIIDCASVPRRAYWPIQSAPCF